MKTKIEIAVSLLIVCMNLSAQTGWKQQPSPLQTRWAKEVSPTNTLKEYPRPQMVRGPFSQKGRVESWTNLNGLWDYAVTEKEAAMPSNYEGKILVPYPIESALSGVKKTLLPTQLLWYKKIFTYHPPLKGGERTLLHFGAVDNMATVYVNGKEIGQHEGGYTEFSFDITDALQEGDNELTVKAYDPTDQGVWPHGKQVFNPQNIYYTPSSGIWQTVWMETVPKEYISSLEITPDIDNSLVRIQVNTTADKPVAITVEGKTVKGAANTAITIPIAHARLWSPKHPYLYGLTVQLGKDKVSSYFGMRKISIAKDAKGIDRIFLNNKPYFNLGVLDQGFWPDGLYTAPTDEALAFDIQAIKAMGFNTIRKHIKIEPARWYYHCDKLGMLVWQDFVNPNQRLPEGAREAFKKQGTEMLTQLHNYPCITTWVLFNERWGQYDQQRLTDWVKQTDPSRIINGHSGELLYVNDRLRDTSDNPYVNSDMTDVHSYPEPRMPLKQNGKAMVVGEFGGVGVSVPYHQWNDLQGWGYVQVKPGELEKKYGSMAKKIEALKQEGLSGSIYTQPFDVEGEENGLLTYDRDIIKIPFNRIRSINSGLNPNTNQANANSVLAKNIDIHDNDDSYQELIAEFKKGKKDSAFLRRLSLMAMRKEDQPNLTRFTAAFVRGLKNVYSTDNLQFLISITRTTKDTSFTIFRNNLTAVDNVLGQYATGKKLIRIIGMGEIDPLTRDKSTNPDWEKIEKTLGDKYGELGKEAVYVSGILYNSEHHEWKLYGKYYKLYFDQAFERSVLHINNMSWHIFEHISDTAILNTAVKAMKYSLEHFDQSNIEAYDTFANLLYKLNQTDEAIKWETKAVELKKGAPDERVYAEVLQKMKSGQPTWPAN